MEHIQPGNVYAFYSDKIKKYGAAQIIGVDDKKASVVILDYIEDHMPKERDLRKLKPLYTDRWFFNHEMEYFFTNSLKPPADYVYIGNVKPVTKDACRSYSYWPEAWRIESEYEWLQIPEKIRKPFKKAQKETGEVVVGGVTRRRSFSGVGDEILSGIKDFSELDALGALARVYASKYYDGLIPFLERRQLIRKLTLKSHGQKQLDLSRTFLHELELDVTGLERLFLNEQMRDLELSGEMKPSFRIISGNDGGDLNLRMHLQNDFIADFDLPALKGLALLNISDFDLEKLSGYRNLKRLRLSGKPGMVSNIGKLAELPGLTQLFFWDIFGFSGDEFPEPDSFPKLETLWLESVPEEPGKAVKKKYKGKVAELGVKKLRKPEWLAENLDNPFRHWDGSEFVPKSKVKKAAEIYKQTRKAVFAAAAKLKVNPGQLDELKQIARDYGLAFNKLQGKTDFIETDEREDIFAALEIIVEDVKAEFGARFDEEELYNAMDEVRDW